MATEYPEKTIMTKVKLDVELGSGFIITLDKAVTLHIKRYVD